MITRVFLFLWTFVGFAVATRAQVFVKSNATGLNNGTSWENAYVDLSAAIHATASGPIWVAAGVYTPSTDENGQARPVDSRLKTFKFKKGIAIFGGFAGTESSLAERNWDMNKTVLSGDIGVLGNHDDNCKHVVYSAFDNLDANTILDGLWIIDGGHYHQYGGAGIYVDGAGTFVITNCVIENNQSYGDGGGIYVFNADPLIENNVFRHNKAFSGGAIYLYYSDAIVRNNQFIENKVDEYPTTSYSSMTGGAITVSSYGSPQIISNLFKGNFARHNGGAIDLDGNYNCLIQHNDFIGNSATNGGAIFMDNAVSSFIFGNVLARNSASESGGAIYVDYNEGPKMINNTIVFNNAGGEGGGMFLRASNAQVSNSIIRSNTTPSASQVAVTVVRADWIPQFRNCNIAGGKPNASVTVFLNNIDVEPQFENPSQDNYHITALSSLIDAGSQDASILDYPWSWSNGGSVLFPTVDRSGNPRVVGSSIDIGAYESQQSKQFVPTDILLSNLSVDQSAEVGTQIGRLETIDADSHDFSYEIVGNTPYFAIQDKQLLVNSSLKVLRTSPVSVTIKATDDQGWSFTKTFSLELINITAVESPNQIFSLYPSKTSGKIFVDGPVSPRTEVGIYTMQGKILMKTNVEDRNMIDMSFAPTGMYIAIISNKGFRYHFRIIKE
jgi:parallel beta-helix repeat protein/predicted outer membrane repeat protein